MITKLRTITESTFPYSKAEFNPVTFCQDNIVGLFDLLPHGSGINYTWHITQHSRKPDLFYAANTYDAMNETGMYCHTYDFTFVLQYNGKGKTVPCQYCHNEYNDKPGYRSYNDMARFGWSLDDFISKLGAMSFSNNQWYTECRGCYTKGYIDVHEWDIIRLNFHGQKEHSCCGYDLKDYLYQTLEFSLHP